ncbi:ferredoxin [Palleronia sp. KMU-117]|uniref:ferredoxin n=1 Tax=Palleronia sp. KMU-117 TaxID=3434108 RepID=UPI003D747ABE
MTLTDIDASAGREGLAVFGAFHPRAGDETPDGTGTLVLLGPSEPGFWPHVTKAPEFLDGAPDPLDRWSSRVIGDLACAFAATALFPFGGPPFRPFVRWALASGRAWQSPVTLLVHETAGLMLSYRGALALTERLELPATRPARPCDTCADRPCLTACPVQALASGHYDVAACHAFLDTDAGQACMSQGCDVRRSCPVSRNYGRLPQQSAFHMARFHR